MVAGGQWCRLDTIAGLGAGLRDITQVSVTLYESRVGGSSWVARGGKVARPHGEKERGPRPAWLCS
jgi:hypothetical protein